MEITFKFDLCVPCAEKLNEDGEKVKCEYNGKKKKTCIICRKRRYCYTYSAIKREDKGNGISDG